MANDSPVQAALVILYYVYPAAVFSYFTIASLVSACLVQANKKTEKSNKAHPGYTVILVLSILYILTFAGQLAVLATQSVVSHHWPNEDHIIIGHLSCILIFGVLLSRSLDEEDGLSYPCLGSWALALAFEATILGLSAGEGTLFRSNVFGIVDGVLVMARCLVFLSLIGICTFSRTVMPTPDEERQPLLPKDTATSPTSLTSETQQSQGSGYGSTLQATEESTQDQPEYSWERREREAKEAMQKRLEEGGSWIEYAKGFKVRILHCPATCPMFCIKRGWLFFKCPLLTLLSRSSFLTFGRLVTSVFNFAPSLSVCVYLASMPSTFLSLAKLES